MTSLRVKRVRRDDRLVEAGDLVAPHRNMGISLILPGDIDLAAEYDPGAVIDPGQQVSRLLGATGHISARISGSAAQPI